MTKNPVGLLFLFAMLVFPTAARAQGTAFTYQGQLTERGAAAEGNYDFIFTVFDSEAGGNAVGQPTTLNTVSVRAGHFAVNVDPGAQVFTGPARWLNIGVRPSGAGAYTVLTPRQALLPGPYAIRAAGAATADRVLNGTVTAEQLSVPGTPPTAGNYLSYNGATLSWAPPADAVWLRTGADAYYAGNVGIGTNLPTAGYRLEVNGATILRPSNGSIQFGSPNAELGLSITPNASPTRADLRFDGSVLKLVAGPDRVPPSAANGLSITTNGNVSVGALSPTPGYRFDVEGSTILRPSNGSIQFGAPNGELGLSITPNATETRADLRFDGTVLKLVAGASRVPPSGASGLAVSTAGNVGIGTASPDPGIKLDVRAVSEVAVYGRSAFEGVHGESSHAVAAGVAGFNVGAGPGVYGEGRGGGAGLYGRSMPAPIVPGLGSRGPGPAIYADGYASQPRNQAGFVKAMVYVTPEGTIGRCYNGRLGATQGGCLFDISPADDGSYRIDFGFRVNDRFAVVTPDIAGLGLSPNAANLTYGASPADENAIFVKVFLPRILGIPQTAGFTVIVY